MDLTAPRLAPGRRITALSTRLSRRLAPKNDLSEAQLNEWIAVTVVAAPRLIAYRISYVPQWMGVSAMSSFVDRQHLALEQDISRLLSEAAGRGVVCVATEAARLADAYPDSGLSLENIIVLITRMAGATNVIMKLAPPAKKNDPVPAELP
jgi:hypothetical protein